MGALGVSLVVVLLLSDSLRRSATLALIAYDHLLTFAGEVHFVWGRKFSGATVIFALNRYVNLFSKIALFVSTASWPNQTDQV